MLKVILIALKIMFSISIASVVFASLASLIILGMAATKK
jgi:hypothetical protein